MAGRLGRQRRKRRKAEAERDELRLRTQANEIAIYNLRADSTRGHRVIEYPKVGILNRRPNEAFRGRRVCRRSENRTALRRYHITLTGS